MNKLELQKVANEVRKGIITGVKVGTTWVKTIEKETGKEKRKSNHNSNRFLPWKKEEIKVPCYGFAGGKETSYCGRRQKECQFHCFK